MRDMETRTTTTTEGKRVSFKYDGTYYLPTSDFSDFKDITTSPFLVAYTTVKGDRGTRIVGNYIEEYDNGLVGYQNFQCFDTLDEANKDFELKKKLTPKLGVYAYCDVFIIKACV